jgi:hypothetical protein
MLRPLQLGQSSLVRAITFDPPKSCADIFTTSPSTYAGRKMLRPYESFRDFGFLRNAGSRAHAKGGTLGDCCTIAAC